MEKNHTSPAKPSRMRPISVFCPVMRASCPSAQSYQLAHIRRNMPMRFMYRSSHLADCRLLRFPLPCQTMRHGRLLPQHPPLFPQRSIGKRIGQLCPAKRPDAVVVLEPQGMVSQDIPLFLWQLHARTGTANPKIPKVLCPRPATLSGRVATDVERAVPDSEPSFDEIHEHPDF